MRPTGNCSPALAERLTLFLAVLPLPRPDIAKELEAGGECEVPGKVSVVTAHPHPTFQKLIPFCPNPFFQPLFHWPDPPQPIRMQESRSPRGDPRSGQSEAEEEEEENEKSHRRYDNHFPPRISPPHNSQLFQHGSQG